MSNSLEAANVSTEVTAVSITFDVCWTPIGPILKVPVPYLVRADFLHAVSTAPKVSFRGKPAFTDSSFIPLSTGDEAGLGGGLTSGVNQGVCHPLTSNPSVRAQGGNVVQHLSLFWMNAREPGAVGNTIGLVLVTSYQSCGVAPEDWIPDAGPPPIDISGLTLSEPANSTVRVRSGPLPDGGAPAPSEEPSDPDAWWRFKRPAFAFPPGPYGGFQTVSHFDTGYAALNFPVNALYSVNNLCATFLNGAITGLGLIDDGLHAGGRAVGFSNSDVDALLLGAGMPSSGMAGAPSRFLLETELWLRGRAAEKAVNSARMAAIDARTAQIIADGPAFLAEGADVVLATNRGRKLEFGHTIVGVRVSGQTVYVHQVGIVEFPEGLTGFARSVRVVKGGWETRVVQFEDGFKSYHVVQSLPITGEGAARFLSTAEVLGQAGDLGPYSVWWNSCTTVGRQFLSAAGLEPPWWARTPTWLSNWFSGEGGITFPLPPPGPSPGP